MSIEGQIPNNPSINNTGDQSMEVALASKMQLILEKPMSDITTKLCNEDFAGEFFKLGDSVNIVKPDPNSVKFEFGTINDGKILAGNTGTKGTTGSAKDARLKCTMASFTKNTLTIDKYAKYAFAISDITKAEGKWNYESGNLELEAHNLRKAHNLLTAQEVVDAAGASKVKTIGTAAAPIEIATGDDLFKKVIIPMRSRLYTAGAITADGQVSYGSNPQQGKSTQGSIFVPERMYNTLLTSAYFTEARGTELADDRIAGKPIDRVLKLDLAIEPALDPSNPDLDEGDTDVIALPSGAAEGAMVIIAGTRNAVTRAGKVLPPQSFVSHERYATEYHGLEIYGEKLVEPKAVVVAFVKLAV